MGLRVRGGVAASTLLTLLFVAEGRAALAQTYDISWWTVDGGGDTFLAGAPYEAGVTAGQADAGGPFVGGPYLVAGGFWALFAGGSVLFADLSITKTDGQIASIPGTPVTYTIVVTNAGPDAAAGAVVFDAPPAVLSGVSWTCTASPGSTCPASGTGPINHTVSLQPLGTATYALTGAVDPSATGTLANTAAATPPAGVSDVNPADNSATDTDALTPQADLAVALADSADPVGSESGLTYSLMVSNSGPSTSAAAVLTDTLPSGAGFVSATPGAPVCTEAGGVVTCALPALLPAASAGVSLDVVVHAGATGSLLDSAFVAGNDPDPVPSNNNAVETTQVFLKPEGELVHGSRQSSDLAAVGGAADLDYYRIAQRPHTSYEVVLDAATGDLGPAGPALERIASDAVTVVQSSVPAGAGSSRSLRWVNAAATTVSDEYVRVGSLGCASDCTPEDRYRLRAWDTTGSISRLNNSGSQATIVILQNVGSQTVAGSMFFWNVAGALIHEEPFSLAPHAELVFPSHTNPDLIGQSGSITVAHDGGLGAIAGKAVALEPATGFTFDTPLLARVR
jgi:uncharacterized repeat protein (TIGR01451 family)